MGKLLAHLQALSEAIVGRYGDAGAVVVFVLVLVAAVTFVWTVATLMARAYWRRASTSAPRGCGPTSAVQKVG